jgi:acylphosphatase
MIARKITYRGTFTQDALGAIYDITRKTEITGQVKSVSDTEIELNLEGDAAVIKLVQHKIEHKVKDIITDKKIEPIPYQYYVGVILLNS